MIAIPNMDKPKSCYNHCLEGFIANEEIGCPLNDYIESHQFKHSIHPNCPLIELEEWNSYSNGKMYALKGTFQAILDDERRNDETDNK